MVYKNNIKKKHLTKNLNNGNGKNKNHFNMT